MEISLHSTKGVLFSSHQPSNLAILETETEQEIDTQDNAREFFPLVLDKEQHSLLRFTATHTEDFECLIELEVIEKIN